jgi:hypothetical protein
MPAHENKPLHFFAIMRRPDAMRATRAGHVRRIGIFQEDPMRTSILAVVTAFVIGGATTGAVLTEAQPAPPPPGPAAEGPSPRPWMHGMPGMHGERPLLRTFALVYRHEDRQLAPADVQKIAEAFLLWQGNHSWKVVDVATTADGPIAFALATPEGSVVARFTMDPHSGRVTRLG